MKRLLEKYLKIYVHESQSFLWISAIFFVIFFVTAIFRTLRRRSFHQTLRPAVHTLHAGHKRAFDLRSHGGN